MHGDLPRSKVCMSVNVDDDVNVLRVSIFVPGPDKFIDFEVFISLVSRLASNELQH